MDENEKEQFDVFTSGHHSKILEIPSKGIHSFWTQRADDLLVCGVLPKKAFNVLNKEADEETRLILPTVKQLQNRKKFLFKATNRMDTEHDLTEYLDKFHVRVYFIFLWTLLTFYFFNCCVPYYCVGGRRRFKS